MNDLQIFLILVFFIPLACAVYLCFYFAKRKIELQEFLKSGLGWFFVPFVAVAIIIYVLFLNIKNALKKDK